MPLRFFDRENKFFLMIKLTIVYILTLLLTEVFIFLRKKIQGQTGLVKMVNG